MHRTRATLARAALALTLAAALAACGTARLFTGTEMPESPGVAEAPWPRLVDTPEAPPPGTWTEDVPDPAVGVATVVELTEVALSGAARAETLAPPVLTEADRRRLATSSSAARAEALAPPLLTEADRSRLGRP